MGEPLTIRLPRPLASVDVGESGTSAPSGVDPGPAAPAPAQTAADLQAEKTQFRLARQALLEAAEKLTCLREELIAQAEAQLLDLALDIAGRILRQEIRAERYDIDPIVKEALMRTASSPEVVVHLHPDDWARCTPAQQDEDGDAGGVRFVSDPSIGRAECVVEMPDGVLELRARTQLDEIGQALRSGE